MSSGNGPLYPGATVPANLYRSVLPLGRDGETYLSDRPQFGETKQVKEDCGYQPVTVATGPGTERMICSPLPSDPSNRAAVEGIRQCEVMRVQPYETRMVPRECETTSLEVETAQISRQDANGNRRFEPVRTTYSTVVQQPLRPERGTPYYLASPPLAPPEMDKLNNAPGAYGLPGWRAPVRIMRDLGLPHGSRK